jgi:hypothetical protein
MPMPMPMPAYSREPDGRTSCGWRARRCSPRLARVVARGALAFNDYMVRACLL